MKDKMKIYKKILFLSLCFMVLMQLGYNVKATETQINSLFLENLKVIAVTDSGEEELKTMQEYNEQMLDRNYYGVQNIKDIKIEYKLEDKTALVEVKKPEVYSNEINAIEIKIVRNEEFIVYHLFINSNSDVVKTYEEKQKQEKDEEIQEHERQLEKQNKDKFVIVGKIKNKIKEVIMLIKDFFFYNWIKLLIGIIILIVLLIIKNKYQENKASKARKELKDRCR